MRHAKVLLLLAVVVVVLLLQSHGPCATISYL
jgi:hypothetical protein